MSYADFEPTTQGTAAIVDGVLYDVITIGDDYIHAERGGHIYELDLDDVELV